MGIPLSRLIQVRVGVCDSIACVVDLESDSARARAVCDSVCGLYVIPLD